MLNGSPSSQPCHLCTSLACSLFWYYTAWPLCNLVQVRECGVGVTKQTRSRTTLEELPYLQHKGHFVKMILTTCNYPEYFWAKLLRNCYKWNEPMNSLCTPKGKKIRSRNGMTSQCFLGTTNNYHKCLSTSLAEGQRSIPVLKWYFCQHFLHGTGGLLSYKPFHIWLAQRISDKSTLAM